MAAVEVLTVGHDDAFRERAREVVNTAPGFESVAEAASAEEALEAALPLRPHLVLVAADMPAIDGVETVRMLKDVLPDMVVILVHHQHDLTPISLRALWEEHGVPPT
jgi:DNA-binding NarL/FixJ family response regulator